jgi:hypothetical protein
VIPSGTKAWELWQSRSAVPSNNMLGDLPQTVTGLWSFVVTSVLLQIEGETLRSGRAVAL